MIKMTYDSSIADTATETDISEYLELFEALCVKSKELGFRAPVCGNFLEMVARVALHLRKPAIGDAIDNSDRIIEIKSTRLSPALEGSDLSVFSWKEAQEGAFDNLLLVVWDPVVRKIFIYDTGWNSKQLRELRVSKTMLVKDKCTAKQNSVVKIMESIIKPNRVHPIRVFNIDKGCFE